MTLDDWSENGLLPLLRFATVLCGSRHLGEDIVQDVLVKAHRDWGRVDGADRPEAYLRRMVVNEFLNWRRKWSRVVPYADLPEAAVADDHPSRHAETDEMLGRIGRLPARQRAVIVLRYYAAMSDPEIAAALGCSAGTVRGYASRGLTALRVDLSENQGARNAH